MKNLEILINNTIKDLTELNIPFGNVEKWSVNTRAKKRWGQCKKIGLNTFEINISQLLLQDDLDDQIAKNVIAHELLHTVKGCFAHKGKWKLLAQKINQSIPDYNIKVRDTFEEITISEIEKKAKYIIKCRSCDFTAKRYKHSRVIDKPYLYRCPKCQGKIYIQKL